jgi:hypothetical protein
LYLGFLKLLRLRKIRGNSQRRCASLRQFGALFFAAAPLARPGQGSGTVSANLSTLKSDTNAAYPIDF